RTPVTDAPPANGTEGGPPAPRAATPDTALRGRGRRSADAGSCGGGRVDQLAETQDERRSATSGGAVDGLQHVDHVVPKALDCHQQHSDHFQAHSSVTHFGSPATRCCPSSINNDAEG